MPAVAKGFVTGLFNKLGYEITPLWRLNRNFPLAQHLSEVFQRFDVNCVVDVGANHGQYGQFVRQAVGYKGQIISVEPVSKNFAALRAAAAGDPNWLTVQCALGRQSGSADINIMRNDDLSSLLEPQNSSIDISQWNTVCERERVAIRTLDEVIAEVGESRFREGRYLKLDTQGYDLEVVAGASGTLLSISAMQTEVSLVPIYTGMPDWLASLKTLNEAGFDVSGMFPVSRDRQGRVLEFDCVLINRVIAGPYTL